ncbi:hypothetical protein BOTCAL_1324g00010 [Botryotinia calthae]|uniref:Uncharacterized protein n=1 Tax=Botryotinia calthae TaxID=38488 RepID=A0A4Y8CF61_9HELO|nr:hypothetical protein BOTCAL_1324g00010 [Botryotinia calthae]
MATVIEATLVISSSIDQILNLIYTVAIDILDDVNVATDMPLIVFVLRASCQEVEREFLNIHWRLIRYGYNSAVNRILDPTQIDPDGWDPQMFVIFEGSFGIPPRTLAVIIPIYKEQKPLIEFLFEG